MEGLAGWVSLAAAVERAYLFCDEAVAMVRSFRDTAGIQHLAGGF